MESNNLQALDMLGHIYSELGDTQKAKGISFMQAADYFFVAVCMPVISNFSQSFDFNTVILACLNAVMVVASLTSPLLSFPACSGAEPRCRPQQVHVPGTNPHRPGGCGLLH